jgi:hypothetical protein
VCGVAVGALETMAKTSRSAITADGNTGRSAQPVPETALPFRSTPSRKPNGLRR